MLETSKIFIAGHNGMVGSALKRKLLSLGCSNLISVDSSVVDLKNQNQTNDFFSHNRPDFVFLAAAKVGGIHANSTFPAEFIYDNLMIQTNVIHAAYLNNISKLLFLGSSCIYPKYTDYPIREEALLTGPLEPTNEAYAIAKIAGIKMCDAYRKQYGCHFISAMPTNLYGPNDHYDLNNSHVIPALLRKFHEAKVHNQNSVTIWGSGKSKREFLHVDDLAEASIFLMKRYDAYGPINVGSGTEISIIDLARLISEIVGWKGEILHDLSKPDGTPRKLLDSSKIHKLGWQHKINLQTGLKKLYKNQFL